MAKRKHELSIYWDDDVTIECRYFPSKKAAKKYAKDNGHINYKIDQRFLLDTHITVLDCFAVRCS